VLVAPNEPRRAARRLTECERLFPGVPGQRLLTDGLFDPRTAVVRERPAVHRHRDGVAVPQWRGEAQRVLHSNRLSLEGERRALLVVIEVAAEVSADRRDLLVGEAAAVGEPAGGGLPFLPVGDRFLDGERPGRPGGRGGRLEERAVDLFADNRALDRP